MKYFEKVFSHEPCNPGRQTEFDIGKALPILCLPFIHCIIECCTKEQLLHGVPYAFDMIIGGPMAAPMFMFCMGATIHYSLRHSAGEMAKRGLKLLLIGFLLNVCRFIIPYMIGYGVTGDAERFLTPLPYFVFGNDVLQFAGLAMLCIALMMKLKTPKWTMLVIALAMSVTGSLFRSVDLGNNVLNVIFGWFIGTEDSTGQVTIVSYFPLLNWLIVPVCGYCFGWLLQRVKDKTRFYLSFSPVLLALAIAYLIIGDHFEIGMFAEGENAYYHMLTYDVAASLALTLGALGVYCAISYVLPKKINAFFTFVSRNITAFFCIHWVFVRFITNVLLYAINGTQEFPVWGTMLISCGILIATIFIVTIRRRIQAAFKARRAAV